MAVTAVNEAIFEEKVLKAAQPVLVDFWASWCGPCKMLAPVVEELSGAHPEVAFCKVNVDEEPELAQKYGVSAIPTLALFRDGAPAGTSVGYKGKEELESWISSLR